MAQNGIPDEPKPRPKRLECQPHNVLVTAFNKFKDQEGHTSEANGVEALLREGLQRRELLPGPKDMPKAPRP